MVDDGEAIPELEPEASALVEAYAQALTRSPTHVDAALAGVSARVKASASASASTAATASSGAAIGKVVVATVVACGVLVVLAVRGSTERVEAAARPAFAGLSVPGSRTGPAPPEPEPAEREPEAPEPTPEPGALETGPEPEPETATRSAKRQPPPRRAAVSPSPPSALAEQLRVLQTARAALRSGNADEAAQILAKHRKRWPKSAVAEERDATAVAVLCAQGRKDEAKTQAAAFRQRHPNASERTLVTCE